MCLCLSSSLDRKPTQLFGPYEHGRRANGKHGHVRDVHDFFGLLRNRRRFSAIAGLASKAIVRTCLFGRLNNSGSLQLSAPCHRSRIQRSPIKRHWTRSPIRQTPHSPMEVRSIRQVWLGIQIMTYSIEP